MQGVISNPDDHHQARHCPVRRDFSDLTQSASHVTSPEQTCTDEKGHYIEPKSTECMGPSFGPQCVLMSL